MTQISQLRASRYDTSVARATRTSNLEAAATVPVVSVGSPFKTQTLNPVVWADLTGVDPELLPLTREIAISIPAVARQRHLVAGTGARLPLRAYAGEPAAGTDPVPLPTQPAWLTRTDGELSPFHRMLWTLDDLIFHPWSLWSAVRAGGKNGPLQSVARVAWERWDIDEAGRIEVDGELARDGSVILIPSPHEGICTFGARSIRMAISNARAAATAARNPSAYIDLHWVGDKPLTENEIDELIGRWAKARRGENGGVSFTPRGIEVHEHGTHEGSLLIAGRNADAVDMSRLVSSPASMADATNAGASLTYETTTGRNGEFIDYGLALYLAAIEARLSQDDCVPAGQRVAFDLTSIRNIDLPAINKPVGPNRED